MNFVKIPGKDFEMQTTQTTQFDWNYLMDVNPSRFKGGDLPVESVSFEDVQTFLERLNKGSVDYVYRLPSEEEWEYCCRAGSTTEYCFGDDEKELEDYAWYSKNSGSKTHDVGQKKPSAWGIFDMHGNVWEWCNSFYFKDETASGSDRVFRGGGWYNDPANLRSARRGSVDPGLRSDALGFRLVRTLRSTLFSSNPLSKSERAIAARKLIRQVRAKLSKLEGLL